MPEAGLLTAALPLSPWTEWGNGEDSSVWPGGVYTQKTKRCVLRTLLVSESLKSVGFSETVSLAFSLIWFPPFLPFHTLSPNFTHPQAIGSAEMRRRSAEMRRRGASALDASAHICFAQGPVA